MLYIGAPLGHLFPRNTPRTAKRGLARHTGHLPDGAFAWASDPTSLGARRLAHGTFSHSPAEVNTSATSTMHWLFLLSPTDDRKNETERGEEPR